MVIENCFHEKRILKGSVKIIKGVAQECFEKIYFRKKTGHEKSFPRDVVLNGTLISGGTEERRQKKKHI